VNVPLRWVWANDPEELPDDDHARCIAAPGERVLARGSHLFTLTTRPCLHLSESHARRATGAFSTLQIEYRGVAWARGIAQQSWGSDRFDSWSRGGEAQHAAGLALFATMEGALAADSAEARTTTTMSSTPVAGDFPGKSLTSLGSRPSGHARRAPRPSLLPLRVGRTADL
jgi:hypothetical protein